MRSGSTLAAQQTGNMRHRAQQVRQGGEDRFAVEGITFPQCLILEHRKNRSNLQNEGCTRWASLSRLNLRGGSWRCMKAWDASEYADVEHWLSDTDLLEQ